MAHFACTHAGRHGGHGGFMRAFERRRAPQPEAVLTALAATMDEGMAIDEPGPAVPPAGYTYLGQFIDHDLSADKRRFTEAMGQAPLNLRTPRLDLDCLYGKGPGSDEDADLYDGDHLALAAGERGLPRQPDGRARLGDERNDSNLIISQLHVAFAHMHNQVVDTLAPGGERFRLARQIVRLHYQWIVLHDFLPRLVGEPTVQAVQARLAAGGQTLMGGQDRALPLEFSAAAFRFGHSMVRSAYVLNVHGGQLLTFDASRPDGNDADDLRGFRPPPSAARIDDWSLLFQFPGRPAPQRARPIDTRLAAPMFQLPVDIADSRSAAGRQLPFRNLHRSELDLGLASGQEVAQALRDRQWLPPGAALLGLDRPITCGANPLMSNIAGTGLGTADLDAALNTAAPLWYYVLKEAEVQAQGAHLGLVGGQLVADVLLGLLHADPAGVLRTGWSPRAGEFGCEYNGRYGIADMLRYAFG